MMDNDVVILGMPITNATHYLYMINGTSVRIPDAWLTEAPDHGAGFLKFHFNSHRGVPVQDIPSDRTPASDNVCVAHEYYFLHNLRSYDEILDTTGYEQAMELLSVELTGKTPTEHYYAEAGTSVEGVTRALKQMGFENVHVVEKVVEEDDDDDD